MPHAGHRNEVISVAMAPALVDQSAANTLSAVYDMKGFDRVRFIYQLGGMADGAILSSYAVESAESNLGNATNIVNAENSSQQVRLPNVPNTSNNSVHVLDIFRPTQRYVGVYVDAVSANITLLGVLGERIRGTGRSPIAMGDNDSYTSFRAN